MARQREAGCIFRPHLSLVLSVLTLSVFFCFFVFLFASLFPCCLRPRLAICQPPNLVNCKSYRDVVEKQPRTNESKAYGAGGQYGGVYSSRRHCSPVSAGVADIRNGVGRLGGAEQERFSTPIRRFQERVRSARRLATAPEDQTGD